VRLYHVNCFGVLPWFLNGRVLTQKSLESHSIGWQVKLCDRYVVPVLRRVDAHGRPPFGQSLMAVARAQ
jgi:hypothetical protein